MTQFSAHLMVLNSLVAAARRPIEAGIPETCFDGDNHWGATKEEMELSLDRDLNDEEITLLSLSRAFGPTPSFGDDRDAQIALRRLWPNGNPTGLRYDWEQLAEELIAFRDGNDNAVFVHSAGLRGVYIATLRDYSGRGYLVEECEEGAWFGDDACPSSYGMACIGWFEDGDAGQMIRSLKGYEVDSQLIADVVQFELRWDQGRMEVAKKFAANWHPEAFAAQLWRDVKPATAWDKAVAALIKLRAVVDDLPACSEQSRCRDALEAMGQ